MTSKERYKFDPEYRERQLSRNKVNHHKWMQFRVYRDLRRVRVSICNYRDSIYEAQVKIKRYRLKITRAIRKKELLELEFGQLRARLKRKKENEARSQVCTEF
jgi:hypothetical protein